MATHPPSVLACAVGPAMAVAPCLRFFDDFYDLHVIRLWSASERRIDSDLADSLTFRPSLSSSLFSSRRSCSSS